MNVDADTVAELDINRALPRRNGLDARMRRLGDNVLCELEFATANETLGMQTCGSQQNVPLIVSANVIPNVIYVFLESFVPLRR